MFKQHKCPAALQKINILYQYIFRRFQARFPWFKVIPKEMIL